MVEKFHYFLIFFQNKSFSPSARVIASRKQSFMITKMKIFISITNNVNVYVTLLISDLDI